jgi:hypothetical protein
MKTHTIHWKSLSNGRIGTGTFVFEREEAERLAEELNRDYPGIHHEAVEARSTETIGGEFVRVGSPVPLQA